MTKALRKIDRIDKAILKTVQADGRISNVELAKRVNLSPSPCLERVKRLENEGFIEGYSARLNADHLGLGKVAFIQVSLEKTTEDVFLDFKKEVKANPIVAECHMVAGGYDYLLKVRFDDMDSYRSILEKVVRFPGVAQTHTYVVIEQVKVSPELPIDLLTID